MAAKPTVGLDIGSVSIRAIEISRTKDRTQIEHFGHIDLPEGAMAAGVVANEKAVTAALRELWATHNFKSKSVALSVAHQQVIVREVEIPNLSPKERRLALPHLVRDVLPMPADQAILDFYPLEEEAVKGAEKKDTIKGLIVAAPKEAVTHTVAAVEKAGLHVERVDLSCFAVLRAVASPAEGAEAIIDVGAKATLFVVHTDGIPQIARMIPRGGYDVTKLISTRLKISMADAEQRKLYPGAEGPDPDLDDAIAEAIRPLIAELRSSISYFAKGDRAQAVSRIVLVGGASQLTGFADELSRALDMPASYANPLQYVSEERRRGRHDLLGHYRSAVAVAVGLALGAAS